MKPSIITRRLLTLAFAAVACITLSLGLWPFHAPHNHVAWLPNKNGLRFGFDGSAFGQRQLTFSDSTPAERSIEIWLQPGSIWDRGTILSFYRPANRTVLLFRQSQTDLELELESNDDVRHARKRYIDHVFRRGRVAFLTVTNSTLGMSVYLDGALLSSTPQSVFSAADFTGQLIVGDSPGQPDSWRGDLFGLAFYHTQLTPNEVREHFSEWTRGGLPQAANQTLFALYPFNDHHGRTIHDRAPSGADLYIPETYRVLDKIALQPFWTEFEISRSYLGAVGKNIVGFIPLGACAYALLLAFERRRAALGAVLLGTLVSVTIEVLQIFLPTRDSGTTDIVTNTLGTWIGVVLCRRCLPIVEPFFPFLERRHAARQMK
jgi:hypothetical protein